MGAWLDTEGRVAVSTGLLTDAPARLDKPLPAVACGSVLTTLPMLLRECLPGRAGEFLPPPKGYYGFTSVLLRLAFLFMAQGHNPEALRHCPPGEWGALLGLACGEGRSPEPPLPWAIT